MDVSLRCIEQSDLTRIALLANDVDIARVTLSLPYPYTRDDAQTWFEYLQSHPNEHVFAIIMDDELIGVTGLVHESEHRRAELGYWLGKSYWKQGCATVAAEMAVGYAFTSLDIDKVYANCFASNAASRRVIEKIGFTLEGKLRNHIIRMGEIHDVLCFGMLKEEYQRLSKK